MAKIRSLGGLSARELLTRTAREVWQDDVFGQAARLSFYHFMAIFPVLLLVLIPLAHFARAGVDMRNVLTGSLRYFLPEGAAMLVTGAIRDLDANAHGGGTLLALAALGAVWAGVNASWALIVGLNTAYETEEDREWSDIGKTATALALAVVALVFTALLTTHYVGGALERAAPSLGLLAHLAEWAGIIGILLISFALFYRFGPNLKTRKWQWSTPGAVIAATLWVGLTLLVREYFNRFAPYQQIYGRIASTAALMIWLYVTSATVLIGAEINSEIEKARESSGAENPARKARSGEEKRV